MFISSSCRFVLFATLATQVNLADRRGTVRLRQLLHTVMGPVSLASALPAVSRQSSLRLEHSVAVIAVENGPHKGKSGRFKLDKPVLVLVSFLCR